MNWLQKNRVRLLVWLALAAIVAGGWAWVRLAERRETERLHPILREIRLGQEQFGKDFAPATNDGRVADFAKAADLTQPQKDDLAKLFAEKFRPAAERWFAAYTNRIPFSLADITLDKFNSKCGLRMYTFMLGSTTLTFIAPRTPDEQAKVGYLMVRQAAEDLNQLPKPGFVPDLKPPVTTTEVIGMVKADSGVEFKLNEVMIRPTAKACALNGGAFVDLLPTGADPNNFLNYKISMVFDANGKLVNYERDPSF